MAATAAGAALTTAHRAQQLAVRAGSLRDLVLLWRAVDPTDLSGTIDVFAQAAALLAGRGFEQSAAVAAQYYGPFRRAEGVVGAVPLTVLAPRPSTAALAGDLRGAALSAIIDARRSGATPTLAKRAGLIKTIGALSKRVLAGGRMTLIGLAGRDPQALGWGRVTAGGACAFCRMLAGRGAAYKTEKAADFEAHDSCACSAEIIYRGSKGPAQAAEYAKEWKAAQQWGRESGLSSKGTSNDALNTYRRFLAGGGTADAPPVTERSG